MGEEVLSQSVGKLSGIGNVRLAQFMKLGIFTVSDLLYHFPRAYQDRGDVRSLAEAAMSGEVCATILTVGSEVHSARLKRGKTLSKFVAFDNSGKCTVSFFNQTWIKDTFTLGSSFRFWGKVERSGRSFVMSSPTHEAYYEGVKLPDFVPVYPLTEGLTQKVISNAVASALDLLGESADDHDLLPEWIRKKYSLLSFSRSLRALHFPKDYETLDIARRRFVLEELYIFALAVSKNGARQSSSPALPMKKTPIDDLTTRIGFELTGAQKRAINDIYADMVHGDAPMCRLVSGDVGSGKTMCAAAAALIALKNGYQAAIMAPTEILANQHYNDLGPLFSDMGYHVDILTGALSAAQKKKARASLASGQTDLIIGTHALITDSTDFANLGLVVTDEQHRFGVMQRAALSSKGRDPHMLVMTATPIPRTLALILYGDLDVSIIDELPPGRQKVDTFVVNSEYRDRLNAFIRRQCDEGHQVYIVCPAVDSDDEGEALVGLDYRLEDRSAPALKSAVKYSAELKKDVFPDLEIAFLHGKLKGSEKDAIMEDFAAGKINILVSTTVIEVGVNVPNATLMIIENAERFGLSQLHQLRGRVGRGKAKSYCVLVSDAKAPSSASERLETIRSSADGYKIAEEDLRLRGPGDFFPSVAGDARQHGDFRFRMASLCDSVDMLSEATALAKATLEDDPELEKAENAPARERLSRMFDLNSNTVS